MRILIIYGTIEGQTRKIARAMEDHLQSLGHAVTCCNAIDEPAAPDDFDLILLGGPVHAGHFPTALKHYVMGHKAAIDARPNAFFAVCLHVVTGTPTALKEAMEVARTFTEACGWEPKRIELIAGALKYLEYDFFKRFMMKQIVKRQGGDTDTSKDYEYTDWSRVRRFCEEVVAVGQETVAR